MSYVTSLIIDSTCSIPVLFRKKYNAWKMCYRRHQA